MDEYFKKKYGAYNGIDTSMFKHIPEISCYNNNYFIGLKREGSATNDLIFVHSDELNGVDDYYHVNGNSVTYIGYSCVEEDILNLCDNNS